MTKEEAIKKGLQYYIDNPKKMGSLFKKMYGEPVCLTCPGSIEHAFNTIKEDIRSDFQKWKMKRGKVIDASFNRFDGVPPGIYTCKNITDEIVNKFLSLGYYKDYFHL